MIYHRLVVILQHERKQRIKLLSTFKNHFIKKRLRTKNLSIMNNVTISLPTSSQLSCLDYLESLTVFIAAILGAFNKVNFKALRFIISLCLVPALLVFVLVFLSSCKDEK